MADQIVIRINAVLHFSREEVEQYLGSGLAEELWREMVAIADDDEFSLCGLEHQVLGSLCNDAETELNYQAERERQATAMAKWEADYLAEHGMTPAQARALLRDDKWERFAAMLGA